MKLKHKINIKDVKKIKAEAMKPVEPGVYTVFLEQYKEMESKSTPGCHLLNLTFKITAGEFKNKKLFHNFVMAHPKAHIEKSMLCNYIEFLDSLGLEHSDDNTHLDGVICDVRVDKNTTSKNPDYLGKPEIKAFFLKGMAEADMPEPQ